jgi:mRNA-degrading endonuclease RelE of RelBE toxin-antitoxin system
MYRIKFTHSALDDLDYYRRSEQQLILDHIEAQLTHQPSIKTRNRKPLRQNQISAWEIRIGRYRVFYNVDETKRVVDIRMIGRKEGNRLFVRGMEYTL